jgi:ubiquinone/menaquinone biosynthesis C-methylase UbiE
LTDDDLIASSEVIQEGYRRPARIWRRPVARQYSRGSRWAFEVSDTEHHALAKAGFQNGALYDAARPNYPEDVFAYFSTVLGLNQSMHAVDLGAGSGIFSRQLQPLVGTVTGVEPSASMRASFRSSSAGMEVLDGSDVSIPLDDDSIDAVFVAQAFHWFDAPRALKEIHRVLVPQGGLGLVWNERDETVEWVAALSRAMQWDTRQPYEVGRDFTDVISSGPFTKVERVEFSHAQMLSREGLLQRVLTTSYISTMNQEERDQLMRPVRMVVDQLTEPIVLPYITTAYTATASLSPH